ncbi:MAG: alpha/beta fold hydrolase [Planctomycetota bacterium]|nr:alpha/beta fold hydrolase [Planctomycetota bacterium]
MTLDDGDQVVLHEDRPPQWRPGDRVAVLVHGLGGSYRSAYMVRVAAKLNAAGCRTFRKDLRGCGAGSGLAWWPFHSGRSKDVAAALGFVASRCPNSPITLIGFSLGGNLVLKLLGESSSAAECGVDSAITACAPIDLRASCRHLIQPANRFYDRRFVVQLLRQYALRRKLYPAAPMPKKIRRPRNLWELDELLTAPICGFRGAEDYYAGCSARRYLSSIKVPTRMLIAEDDPLVPSNQYDGLELPVPVRLCKVAGGGHLGFITSRQNGGDRQWLDQQIVGWTTGGESPNFADHQAGGASGGREAKQEAK